MSQIREDKEDLSKVNGRRWRLFCKAELTLLALITFFMYFVTANAIDQICHQLLPFLELTQVGRTEKSSWEGCAAVEVDQGQGCKYYHE